jgi:predicted DNA-binding transcriptional regulator AlpA
MSLSTCQAETTEAAPMLDGGGELIRAERLRDAFELLSPTDLAALIGVDERTLTVWRAQCRGPDFVKLGRAVFYRRADVNAWIELNVSPTDRAA